MRPPSGRGLPGLFLLRALDLEPDASRLLAYAPAGRELPDEDQAPAPVRVGLVRGRGRLEAGTAVADLHPDPLVADRDPQIDRVVGADFCVLHAVRDQLAHEQADVERLVLL